MQIWRPNRWCERPVGNKQTWHVHPLWPTATPSPTGYGCDLLRSLFGWQLFPGENRFDTSPSIRDECVMIRLIQRLMLSIFFLFITDILAVQLCWKLFFSAEKWRSLQNTVEWSQYRIEFQRGINSVVRDADSFRPWAARWQSELRRTIVNEWELNKLSHSVSHQFNYRCVDTDRTDGGLSQWLSELIPNRLAKLILQNTSDCLPWSISHGDWLKTTCC